MGKNIMILGAGQYQVPLIRAAREMGHSSYAVGRADGSPGIALADVFVPVDFSNYDLVLQAAREHRFSNYDLVLQAAREHRIDGVCSASTDLTVPIIGRLVDDLHLPGFGSEIAFRTTNKVAMKKAFREFGVPTARFRIVESMDEAVKAAEEIGYPVMIKAVDTMGSQGITQVDSSQEIGAAWKRALAATKDRQVLVEEHLAGFDFCVMSLLYEGELKYTITSRKAVTPPPFRATLGHAMPSGLDSEQERVVQRISEMAMKSLGLRSAQANIDCILTSDGPRVVEVGARLGATCMPESGEILTGMNLYKQAIALALGLAPDCTTSTCQPNASHYLTAPKAGLLVSITVAQDLQECDAIHRLTIYAKPGDRVDVFRQAPDRLGEVIVRGRTSEEAEDRARETAESIELEIK